jgi:hypothetical protein
MKINIGQVPVLAVPNLLIPFEVETDASGYVMGAVLMQGGRPIYYHYEVFNGAVLNYPTYENYLYSLVQAFKMWNNYLMRKESIINIDNQSLQYL